MILTNAFTVTTTKHGFSYNNMLGLIHWHICDHKLCTFIHLNHVAQISMVLFEHTRQVLYTTVVRFFKVPSNLVKENANSPDLFSIGKIFEEVKFYFKIAKMKYFWDFQLWEFEKIRKNGQISTHGSSRLPIRYKYVLISCLVYSQIWLNIPMEDCHFDYITILQRKRKLQLTRLNNQVFIHAVQRTYHDHTHNDEHDHDKTLWMWTNLDRFSRSYIKTLGQVGILSVPNSNNSIITNK